MQSPQHRILRPSASFRSVTRSARALLTFVLAFGAILTRAGTARARPGIDLDVTLDPGTRRLEGRVAISVVNTSATALREVPLWLYPNRLGVRPAALGDVSYHWLYPAAFSPGSMILSE